MRKKIGVYPLEDNSFQCVVWAPFAKSVELEIIEPNPASIAMEMDDMGYWQLKTDELKAGSLYFFNLDQTTRRPDPASLSQPQGVHGPSEAVSLKQFHWEDREWLGTPLKKMTIYELHVGAFTPEGTFESTIHRLDYLKDLGINAIEIMPVAQFPGSRNWGYDGVYPFAAQNSYGGAAGLQALVNACHQRGIAVILDVVYNHMGPEGNYLSDFGPYFTEKYKTPWGLAINFDDAYSDEVRNFFIQNALMWLRDFHIDGLRLDAVHAIKDMGAKHFLRELSEETHRLSEEAGIRKYLIGECDLNDVRYTDAYEKGGYGLDAQWIDEFHHAIHAVVTGERSGYYEDFGQIEHLSRGFRDTFIYNGRYSPHRQKTFGNSAENTPFCKYVVFSQNHDQVGNRMLGERLSQLISFEALKLVAGTVFVSPYVPLLFMGEEYGEKHPFYYFVSHTDEDLVEAVRKGRKKEFEAFHRSGEMPDPQSPDTFQQSKLGWNLEDNQAKTLFNYYKEWIKIRKERNVFSNYDRSGLEAEIMGEKTLLIKRTKDKEKLIAILNYDESDRSVAVNLPGQWSKLIDSAEERWLGPGSAAPAQIQTPAEFPCRPSSIIVYHTNRI